jgi:hypothetical protein
MRYVVMAILMTLICLDLSVAQTRDQQRDSLQGLKGVEVVIESLRPDAEADGLSQEAIRTAVELILRSKGIRVLTRSESLSTPAAPYLYVKVSTYNHSSDLYAYAVTVEVMQKVSLAKRPQQMMSATTWEKGAVGTTGHSNIRMVIDSVESKVKEFANDFLAANPR